MQRIKGKRVRRISSSGHLGHEVKRVSVLRLSVQLRTGHSAFKHHGEQRVVDADLGLQKLSESNAAVRLAGRACTAAPDASSTVGVTCSQPTGRVKDLFARISYTKNLMAKHTRKSK